MGVLSTEEIKARGLDTSVILEPNQYEEVDYADNTLTHTRETIYKKSGTEKQTFDFNTTGLGQGRAFTYETTVDNRPGTMPLYSESGANCSITFSTRWDQCIGTNGVATIIMWYNVPPPTASRLIYNGINGGSGRFDVAQYANGTFYLYTHQNDEAIPATGQTAAHAHALEKNSLILSWDYTNSPADFYINGVNYESGTQQDYDLADCADFISIGRPAMDGGTANFLDGGYMYQFAVLNNTITDAQAAEIHSLGAHGDLRSGTTFIGSSTHTLKFYLTCNYEGQLQPVTGGQGNFKWGNWGSDRPGPAWKFVNQTKGKSSKLHLVGHRSDLGTFFSAKIVATNGYVVAQDYNGIEYDELQAVAYSTGGSQKVIAHNHTQGTLKFTAYAETTV